MRYVIIGNSDYAKLLLGYVLENKGNSVVAFSVEEKYISMPEIEGIPVIPYESIENEIDPHEVELLMAVGYSEMNDIRKKLFVQYKMKGYTFGSYVHPTAIIADDCIVGEGNIFFEGVIIERGCSIGNVNAFFFGTVIGHDCNIGSYNSFSRASVAGRVTIENNCFVGMGAVISSDVVIRDYVLIGATAYVTENIESGRAIVCEKSKIIDREISKRIM